MNDLEKKLERVIEIVKFNRFVSKGLRRWIIRCITKIEEDIKTIDEDLHTMKKILVAISKKVNIEIKDDEEDDEDEIAEPPRKNDEDLVKLENKIDRMGWSYFI